MLKVIHKMSTWSRVAYNETHSAPREGKYGVEQSDPYLKKLEGCPGRTRRAIVTLTFDRPQ